MDLDLLQIKNHERKNRFVRRLIHISTIIVPLLYYWYQSIPIIPTLINRETFVLVVILLVILFEVLRLWRGWNFYGQRRYETKTISAFAWTVISIGIVLLFAPQVGIKGCAIGLPLIWSYSLADPFMGECRLSNYSTLTIFVIGLIVTAAVWVIATGLLGTPVMLGVILTPIIAGMELIGMPWIDDSAFMLLVPLILIYLIRFIFPF